jgi:hypothetical protein
VTWSGGQASFVLLGAAEAWAQKIRSPRTRIDKLGVKPSSRVSVLGVRDVALLEELRDRASAVTQGRLAKDPDIVVVQLNSKKDLARLRTLRAAIPDNGAVWALWPKGREELREDDLRGAALRVGLVDIKVVSVSGALSGLKLVVPLAQRGRKS